MPPFIEIKDLSKRFQTNKGSMEALCRVNLNIDQGDVFGIIGLSGAGKSTLIRSLASLERPSCGTITIAGEEITSLSPKELKKYRRTIGMIFQHFNLLSSRTVFENIAYPLEIGGISKEEQKKRVEELLEMVGLSSKRDAYPSQLSGGEKQRVGIARALANHPKVLFCDEATSALDPKTTREILLLLKKINQTLGVTIVLITHEMEVIKQVCNKVAVIEMGKIVEQGSVLHLCTDPKHPTTKRFLQYAVHDIPPHFFKERSPERKLLRLCFQGEKAGQPVITQMVKKFNVDANILLGWIDSVQSTTVGTLILELTGKEEAIASSLKFLKENTAHCEVMENGK